MAARTAQTLLIRADAGGGMGYGHIMRCIALAQACQQSGYAPVFVSQCDSQSIKDRLVANGMEHIAPQALHPHPADLAGLRAQVAQRQAPWVVVDGYHFDAAYCASLHDGGTRVVVLDDIADQTAYQADILLNQNIYAPRLAYPCNPDAIRLMGLRYLLLREEVMRGIPPEKAVSHKPAKVLVTMGGSDPHHTTRQVLQALQGIREPQLDITVVVGGSNPDGGLIKSDIVAGGMGWRVLDDPPNLSEWMSWADIAITGGGSTCYELAAFGVPMLIITLAENQRMLANGIGEAGAGISLGWHADISLEDIVSPLLKLLQSPETCAAMSQAGQRLADGLGASRVASWMQDLSIQVRPAQPADSRMVFEWANDPLTRSVSFSNAAIPWEDHQRWYERRMADPGSVFYIAESDEGDALGIVRFQVEGDKAVASINIAPGQRGRGYGSPFLRIASKRLFQERLVARLDAYIKPDNAASVKVFSRAGYRLESRTDYQGHPADLYVLKEEEL